MKSFLLISISGEDRPGLTAVLSTVLAEFEADVLDIGQAVIHDTLSLGMLVGIKDESRRGPLVKELLYKTYDMSLKLRIQEISEPDYEKWAAQGGQRKYLVTLLGRRITGKHMAEAATVISRYGFNVEGIARLSGRTSFLPESKKRLPRACVQLSLSQGKKEACQDMRAELMKLASRLDDLDIAFQEDNIYRRNRRMVVFDMDSTLIQTEVIDELAFRAGVGEQVSAITASAMAGEIDFKESFCRRVALLKALPESVLAEVAEALPLSEGVDRLFRTLKIMGFKTAVISGGFMYFARHLQKRLGLDFIYANELEIKDALVTGNIIEPVVDGAKKAEILKELAKAEGLSLEQVIAVGDGANDIPMLSTAGLGIAYDAKPLVKAKAEQSISNLGLDGILYLIGFRDRDSTDSEDSAIFSTSF